MNISNTLLLLVLALSLLAEPCCGLLRGQLQAEAAAHSVDHSSGGVDVLEQRQGQGRTTERSLQELVQLVADGNSTSPSSPPASAGTGTGTAGTAAGFAPPPWALVTTGPDGRWLCDRPWPDIELFLPMAMITNQVSESHEPSVWHVCVSCMPCMPCAYHALTLPPASNPTSQRDMRYYEFETLFLRSLLLFWPLDKQNASLRILFDEEVCTLYCVLCPMSCVLCLGMACAIYHPPPPPTNNN